MQVIRVNDVNQALPLMLDHLIRSGLEQKSRAGNVLVAPTPVTTVYEIPRRRVLFSAERDANPFFHLMEALWMLAGRRDVKTVHHYVRRMAEFSDDGKIFHGAYGYRWRYNFGNDQIESVLYLLKESPHTRRAVIQIWDCMIDLGYQETGKDKPCNLIVTPWIIQRRHGLYLDMTVFCRSNDIIWGAAGANAVHFSILQEYLATRLGLPVGKLYQVSNNFHAYVDILEKYKHLAGNTPEKLPDPYMVHQIPTTPLITDPDTFDYELKKFWDWHDYMLDYGEYPPKNQWENNIFPDVAVPMAIAYNIYRKRGICEDIFAILRAASSSDWIIAAFEWMKRREAKKNAAV